ncbi:hypothetical protein RJ639_040902 [Escallonia herrerae]|uniref:Uncharacterized protein n=1 Tax=Escallonia herrerae TaxID=1293975 RepID=A0AA88WJV4_9ASTE|nr:hypothetical protein RJ639_040902 [Escallonia herrerae]
MFQMQNNFGFGALLSFSQSRPPKSIKLSPVSPPLCQFIHGFLSSLKPHIPPTTTAPFNERPTLQPHQNPHSNTVRPARQTWPARQGPGPEHRSNPSRPGSQTRRQSRPVQARRPPLQVHPPSDKIRLNRRLQRAPPAGSVLPGAQGLLGRPLGNLIQDGPVFVRRPCIRVGEEGSDGGYRPPGRELDAVSFDDDGKGLLRLVKALIAAGRGESTVGLYGMMRRRGWGATCAADDYVAKVLSRGLRRLGQGGVADEIDREFGDLSKGSLESTTSY